jgi:hypothetical protein
LRLSLAIAAVALSACPSPPPPPPDAGTPDAGPTDSGTPDAGHPPKPDAGFDAGFTNLTISQWCHDYALAQCERDQRCGRIDDTTFPICMQSKTLFCDAPAYARSVSEGKLQFDATQAAACLNAFGSGSCELAPFPCSFVFLGLTPPDAGCYVPEDCEPDSGFCDPYDNLCPHHCSAWVRLGDICNDPFAPHCAPGLGCEYPDDGGFQRSCIPILKEGDPCLSFNACDVNLVCEPGNDGGEQCLKQYNKEGQPCGVTNGFPFCDANLFCRQDIPMTGTPAPGICEKRAGLADTCYGFGTCLPSLRCSSAIGGGTCQPFAALGAPCSNNFYGGGECQDGLYCAKATSRCVPLPTDGGDCSNTGSEYECATGYSCDYDVITMGYLCHALRADGQACSYDGQCLSNECEYGMTADGGYESRCVRCSQVADAG